jgi:Mrp family chromosome partitioning ATPase
MRAFDPIAEDRVRLGEIVQVDMKSGAHFIPAPKADDLQLLLHSGGFTTLLEEARQAYDIIIIDTPPVMTSADAASIGRFADICLLPVRWGRTSWERSRRSGFSGCAASGPDGIVMVGVDTGSAGYGQLVGYKYRSLGQPVHTAALGPEAHRGGVSRRPTRGGGVAP